MIGQTLPLGVVAAALSNDPRQAAAAAHEAKFAGLEFDAISSSLDLTQLSHTGLREFRHLLSSHGQQLVALRADVGPKGFSPGADVDRLLAGLLKVMEAAKGLSPTPMVTFNVGPLPEPAAESKPAPRVTPQQAGLLIIPELTPPPKQQGEPARPGTDPALVAHVDAALRELAALADRTGVTVALRGDLASFAALLRAVAAAACPWFGVDFDPVAMLCDAWPEDEIFSRLGPLIRHVRGRDAIAGSDKRTRPAVIGRGSIEWEKLLADLDAAGYRGWITIDPLDLTDRRAAVVAGAAHLKTFVP